MGWGLGRYPPHTAGITQRSPPHRHRRAQRGSHLRLGAPQIPCVFVGTEYRVAGRPRGAAGACSPVLLSSAAVQPLALAASNAVRAASVVFSACCRACAGGGDGFAVCVECVAEFFHQGDAGGEEVLRGGALVGLRCGHDGETPGRWSRTVHRVQTADGRTPGQQTVPVPSAGVWWRQPPRKLIQQRWRAAGWLSLRGLPGGAGALGPGFALGFVRLRPG